MVLLVKVIGLIMILIYWIQFHKLMGNLVRSSTVHASLAIFQMIFLMIYLYRVRFFGAVSRSFLRTSEEYPNRHVPGL